MNRRDMLAMMGAAAVGGLVKASPLNGQIDQAVSAGGHLRIFDIKAAGAVGDGKTMDTDAINRTIDQCSSTGGGMVYVPPGVYLCGTIVLKSNVTFYIEATATILGSTKSEDYTLMPGPPEQGDQNQRHLIFARDAINLTIAGTGTIDGQGPTYWTEKKRPPTTEEWGDVATFDFLAGTKRPSPMLEFFNCTNLRIHDIHIINAASWTLRPISCTNVFIDGITIKNSIHGPNNDGLDPTCCKNVFISNCLIETSDDCICLKSENYYTDELKVSKNIVITNCVLSSCCNGLKFGTATYGGFENVTFSNSVIYNEDVRINQRVISGICIETVDGGYVEGVTISNIRMQRTRAPIFIRRGARKGTTDNAVNYVRGIMIDNVHASGSIMTSSVTGLPGANVEDITLSNIRIDTEEAGTAEQAAKYREVPEVPKIYPEARQFGHLPAHGLYARHVTGLRLRSVEFRAIAKEARPALVCDDVVDLDVDGLRSTPTDGDAPAVRLIDTQQAFLRGCKAPLGTKTFLDVVGNKSGRVVLTSSDMTSAKKIAEASEGAPLSSVTITGNVR